MNVRKVINQLKRTYPGKKIIKEESPGFLEIICEAEPCSEHPEYSRAIAVIDKNQPHFHRRTTETYRTLKGTPVLFVDGKKHRLKEGEELVVRPSQVHWLEGEEVWVECFSQPGWTIEDHLSFEK